MSGGILVCGSGSNDTTLFFVLLSGVDAFFFLCDIDLRFASTMNSVAYVAGGTAHFERVKMDRQYLNEWVNPLIEVNSTGLSVIVNFFYSNITNCHYVYRNTTQYVFKSAIVFFVNTSTNKAVTLNMNSSSFRNNSVYLSGVSYALGAFCRFQGSFGSLLLDYFYCCMYILILLINFLLFVLSFLNTNIYVNFSLSSFFFLIYSDFSVNDCVFENCRHCVYRGGFPSLSFALL
jgi:hypothetical protein